MKKILLTVVLGVAVGAVGTECCAASSGTIGHAASPGQAAPAAAPAVCGAGD